MKEVKLMRDLLSQVMKLKVPSIILIFGCVLFIFFQISCEDYGISPGNVSNEEWYGQVVSEFVFEVLKPDGTVWTWGNNYAGTLGNGTTKNSDTPCKVLNLSNVISIDQFWGAAIAADRDGNIWFWGSYVNWVPPPNDSTVSIPKKIAYLSDIKSISLWGSEVYLLTRDGSIWFMNIDPYSRQVIKGPIRYSEINNAIAIDNQYALLSDGKIYHLGTNEYLTNVPNGVIAIQSTQQRMVVLSSDGTVWAWGKNNFGQLGNGTFEDSEVPTKVKNLSNVIAISANYDYNLALKEDGTVWTWGYAGHMGDKLVALNTPIKIDGLENVVLIYAGANCLVMKADGTYWIFSVGERIPRQVQFN
jgi:alpha-tubulin suppressor-like RCC1 family protein